VNLLKESKKTLKCRLLAADEALWRSFVKQCVELEHAGVKRHKAWRMVAAMEEFGFDKAPPVPAELFTDLKENQITRELVHYRLTHMPVRGEDGESTEPPEPVVEENAQFDFLRDVKWVYMHLYCTESNVPVAPSGGARCMWAVYHKTQNHEAFFKNFARGILFRLPPDDDGGDYPEDNRPARANAEELLESLDTAVLPEDTEGDGGAGAVEAPAAESCGDEQATPAGVADDVCA